VKWKKQMTKRSFPMGWIIMIMSGLLAIFSATVPQTEAYFHAGAQNQGNIFNTDSIKNYLYIAPGKVQATFPGKGNTREVTPRVASYNDKREIMLNFGEVQAGESRSFPEVLALKNIAGSPIKVCWKVEGKIKELFEDKEGSLTLLPENTVYTTVYSAVYGSAGGGNKSEATSPYSLDVKLKANSPPGLYEGYLTINVNGDFLSMRIPAKALVREKR